MISFFAAQLSTSFYSSEFSCSNDWDGNFKLEEFGDAGTVLIAGRRIFMGIDILLSKDGEQTAVLICDLGRASIVCRKFNFLSPFFLSDANGLAINFELFRLASVVYALMDVFCRSCSLILIKLSTKLLTFSCRTSSLLSWCFSNKDYWTGSFSLSLHICTLFEALNREMHLRAIWWFSWASLCFTLATPVCGVLGWIIGPVFCCGELSCIVAYLHWGVCDIFQPTCCRTSFK